MSSWLVSHWYLLAVVLLVGVGAACVWYIDREARAGNRQSILSYLLIWPAIFQAERKAKVKTSTRFVVAGVIVMLLLVIAGTLINGRSR